MNATNLFHEMYEAIAQSPRLRKTGDLMSPQKNETVEAAPFLKFIMRDVANNVVRVRPLNELWAAANTFHFFANTEYAAPLRKYNARECDRFLTGDQWKGAYGAIAMGQIGWCYDKLNADTTSRRAFVSMGEMLPEDINRPACWNNLHFMVVDGKLSMHVYQRSLNLWNVMPYDCIVLTNILSMLAHKLDLPIGELHWTVGSLHMMTGTTRSFEGITDARESMLFNPRLLDDPMACRAALEHVQDFL